MYKILIVDDDPDIIEFLSYNLRNAGFEVDTAANGKEAIDKAYQISPDLIIMDVMMPEMDGIETTDTIRKIPEFHDIVIVFLTARGEDYSQLAGYDAGADDYIVKPIKPKILISKLKALLKRNQGKTMEVVAANNHQNQSLRIDKERYLIFKGKEQINLPRKEFELLFLLMSRPGKVFLRDEIYTKVWGNETIVGERTIDVHVRKIRTKIGNEFIKTIKGVGYKFEDITSK